MEQVISEINIHELAFAKIARKNKETFMLDLLLNKNANARTSHCMQKGGLGAGI